MNVDDENQHFLKAAEPALFLEFAVDRAKRISHGEYKIASTPRNGPVWFESNAKNSQVIWNRTLIKNLPFE